MIIAVIDGMGGGIGAQVVTQLRQELSLEVEILALGANAIATDKMMRARANRGATGENAIRVSINRADFILAPIGVVVPNSLMGEITPGIATAVAGARGHKLLLPINHPSTSPTLRSWASSGRRSQNRSAPPSRSSSKRWEARPSSSPLLSGETPPLPHCTPLPHCSRARFPLPCWKARRFDIPSSLWYSLCRRHEVGRQ